MATNANNLFELYLQSVTDFAQTVVIKLDDVAQAINSLVIQETEDASSVDETDKTTWKYYQNISGTYHSIDKTMYVESLDGNGQIAFNKTTLANNPITKEAYAFGSAFYNELVASYPTQELLILGILYPCDLAIAIDAKEGTILAYPSSLVEDAETEFIDDLQDWIYSYLDRWVNRAYTINNNLYTAAYLGQLTLNMVPKILNLRLRKCKTNQAHSFHIGQYLRSHGFLDSYIAELTQEQILNFYRNINYYVRHVGTKANFDKLIDLTMEKRGLPIYAYDARHNPISINYTTPGSISNIDPSISFVKRPLNNSGVIQTQPNATLEETFSILESEASGNEEYQTNNAVAINDKLVKSKNAYYKTKVIESTLDLTKNTYVQATGDIVLNQWILLAATGVYRYVFNYLPPGATAEIQLNQQQAVALWTYAITQVLTPITKPQGYVESTTIPQLGVARIFKDTIPTKQALLNIVDTSLITEDDVDVFLSLVPEIPTGIYTASDFQTYCSTVFLNGNNMYRYYSYMEHPLQRAMGQMVSESLYCNKLVNLTSFVISEDPYEGQDWTTFLNSVGFNLLDYSKMDYYNLSVDLYKQATGAELNSIADPANIQEAMVSLLRLLSSYSVSFVYTPSVEDAIPLNHPDVRIAKLALGEFFSMNIPVAEIDSQVNFSKEFEIVNYDWNKQAPLSPPVLNEKFVIEYDPTSGFQEIVIVTDTPTPFLTSSLGTSTSFDPQAEFNALSDEEKITLAALNW